MNRVIDHIDRSRLHLAANTSLAIVLSIGIAFWLDLSATITAVTALMIQQGYVGATMQRGLLRLAGGFTGAVFGLVLLALFSQDREVLIVAVALGAAVICFLFQGKTNWYAYIITIASMVLVAYGNIEHPQHVFQFTVYWVSGIAIAIVVVSVVHGVLWSPTTANVFNAGLRDSFGHCRSLMQLTLDIIQQGGSSVAGVRSIEQKMILGLPKMRATLQTAAFDNWRIEKYEDAYQCLLDQVAKLSGRVIGVVEHLKTCQSERDIRQAIQQSRVLPQILQSLITQIGHLVDSVDAPRDGTLLPDLDRDRGELNSLLESLGKDFGGVDLDVLDSGLLIGLQWKLRQLSEAIVDVRNAIATVETARSLEMAQSVAKKNKQAAPPLAPRLVKSFRAFLVMIAVPCIWILTDWPMALTRLMLYSAVLASLSCLLPVIPRRAILTAIGAGALGGAILYFGVLPMLDGYSELAVALFLGAVPYCYLIGSPRPDKMIIGLFGGMIMLGLIDLSLVQKYSYSNYMNNLIGYSGGFMIGMIILSLFDTATPEQVFCGKTKAFFKAYEEALDKLTTIPPWTDNGKEALASQKVGLLKVHFMCALWMQLFHPQRTSPNESKQLKSLLESMESLIFRLQLTEDARRQLPDRAAFSPLIAAEQELRTSFGDCLRGVRDTMHGQVLTDASPKIDARIQNYQHQLRVLRDSPAIMEVDRETTGHMLVLAEYYRALALALEECLRTAKATNWRKLGGSYI